MRWRLDENLARVEPVKPARVHLRLVDGGAPPPVAYDGEEGESGVIERLERPRQRGDCRSGFRPCPWVSCKHHLYLDVGPGGVVKVNHPHVPFDRLKATCALDVAERGEGTTLEETGRLMNITRERVRQIEARALRALLETHGEATLRALLMGLAAAAPATRAEELLT